MTSLALLTAPKLSNLTKIYRIEQAFNNFAFVINNFNFRSNSTAAAGIIHNTVLKMFLLETNDLLSKQLKHLRKCL